MQSKAEVVTAFFDAIEQGRIEDAGSCLSETFEYTGPSPKPIYKQQFLELHRGLINAIPTWHYNITDLEEQGDIVKLVTRITGTNSGRINIMPLGLHDLSATGHRVEMPPEPVQVTFSGDKISSIQADKVPNGGISGVLEQLEIEVPAMAII